MRGKKSYAPAAAPATDAANERNQLLRNYLGEAEDRDVRGSNRDFVPAGGHLLKYRQGLCRPLSTARPRIPSPQSRVPSNYTDGTLIPTTMAAC